MEIDGERVSSSQNKRTLGEREADWVSKNEQGRTNRGGREGGFKTRES